MKNNIFFSITIVLLGLILFLGVRADKMNRKIHKKLIYESAETALEEYAKKEELVNHLKVHDVVDINGKSLSFQRIGRDYDGGYIIPTFAAEKTDAVLGYGIAGDASFEEQFSDLYNVPSFGFDCGHDFTSKNKKFTFIRECIANDKFIYQGQKSSKQVSSYSQQWPCCINSHEAVRCLA